MTGRHFSLTDNPGANQVALPSNPTVLARLDRERERLARTADRTRSRRLHAGELPAA
jgi:hypothetical protein